jgi:hypothetical protein
MKLAAHAFHLLDIAVYLHARQPPDGLANRVRAGVLNVVQ